MPCSLFEIGLWNSVFSEEQIKEINKEIKKNLFQKEPQTEAAQNASKIGDFFHIPCSPLMELLHPWLYQCQLINRHHFGYDVDWNLHLDKFNYNVYGESGEYGWHVDANTENTKIDKKLTCLLNLSEEPYEGGEFKLVGVDKKIKFDSGEGLVFTSLQARYVDLFS